jgi:hypothetical protein
MSLRFLFHLFALCIAAAVFLLLPEQRFAAPGGAGLLGSDGSPPATADGEEAGAESDARDDGFWEDVEHRATRTGRSWPGFRARVLDLAGERVPGLYFHLGQQRSADPNRLEGAARSLHAASDLDGTFEILVADAPGALTLASTEWVLLGEWRRQLDEWRIGCDVLVVPSVSVAGRVTSADGSGLEAEVRAGAAYTLPQAIDAEVQPRDGFFSLACQADAQGRFTLGQVPALPTTRLHVRTPDGRELTLPLPEFAPGDMHIVVASR